jgi:hypothetical protein
MLSLILEVKCTFLCALRLGVIFTSRRGLALQAAHVQGSALLGKALNGYEWV